jgi:glycerate 2-kinase
MTSKLLRRHALSIFRASLDAADPAAAVERRLREKNYSKFRNIFVIGAGKAGASMAQATERVLGRRITAGLIHVSDGHLG